MANSISSKLYIKISDGLLNSDFLKKNSLNRELIKKHIKEPLFVNGVNDLVKNKDFSYISILKLCTNILKEISPNYKNDDWVHYIYQYTLNKSFPHAVEIELTKELNAGACIYLQVLRHFVEFERRQKSNDSKNKCVLNFLTNDEEKKLKSPTEYRRFKRAFFNEYVFELMKLSQEIYGHSTLDHICGVHHIALHVGRQLHELGLPVDLGRVSGSAAGHDIGKYGCKGEELKRVPYLHYYYTDLWFKKHNIPYIGHIATNHSTWDLELENLPLESLILIYSDFRVKNKPTKNNKREMHIFTLDESFEIVLGKLDNLDAAKEKRYQRVYSKLKDFENFLIDLGVCVDPNVDLPPSTKVKRFSLMKNQDIIENLKYLAINHNINLMYKLRSESSLSSILEMARSENDWKKLRGYLQIFEEYSTYLTQKQKLMTLNFLYELLIHREDDIRKQCAELIGILIASFDEEYRKEVPKDVIMGPSEITSFDLFDRYLQLFLYPDHKIIEIHRQWIGYSLRIMVSSLFNHCSPNQSIKYKNILLSYYKDAILGNRDIQFYLLQTVRYVPISNSLDDTNDTLFDFMCVMLESSDIEIRLSALDRTYNLLFRLDEKNKFIWQLKKLLASNIISSEIPAENFLKMKIAYKLQFEDNIIDEYKSFFLEDNKRVSDIFLKNLKSATNWINKKIHIELLLEQVIDDPVKNGLHTAMHFCNLIKVSAIENVRNHAGEALLKIFPFLSLDQRNDVAVELLRGLEIQGYQFTKYIPYYLGQIILFLHPVELDEIIDDFIDKIKVSSTQINFLLLKTIGVAIENYPKYKALFSEDEIIYKNRLLKMLGILLNGLVNYDVQVKQEAFRVIGIELFGSKELSLEQKNDIFCLIGKKVLTLLPKREENQLLFLNNAASLNHIYRFISDYAFFKGTINLDHGKRIAFFPGTFDPFSLSHKEIAKEIRNMGFEVYLAVDEFSWSKRTQPHMLRRKIISMSVADEFDIYLYPEDLPINIAHPEDLEVLKSSFTDSEVYIVVGSDVVLNASGYKSEIAKNSIHSLPHIVFERRSLLSSDEDDTKLDKALERISGNIIRLTLSPQYEDISSTQIRNYIDENRDISELIDPLSQKYIYSHGIYKREPQYKTLIQTKSLSVEHYDEIDYGLARDLCNQFFDGDEDILTKLLQLKDKLNTRAIVIRDINENKALGFSVFHWVRSSMLFNQFENHNISEYIRENAVGRIIVLDGIFAHKTFQFDNLYQIILTETLSFCLAKDYTYAIFRSFVDGFTSSSLYETLKLQGFQELSFCDKDKPVFAVSMTNPCTLDMDVNTIIKEPFRSNINVKRAMLRSRKRLQRALTKLYPGQLVLSFDREMLYGTLIDKICQTNDIPSQQVHPRQLGTYMCVPFGSILKGYVVPNTVTKSMHTEKMFAPDLESFTIGPFPYYMSLENQIKVLRSFNRPVILVDDLLNKGYRIKAIDPLLKNENINVKRIIVGILSGRGKELMDIQKREVDSAYFIPNLKVWFNESLMYPFIGGDTVWRGYYPERNLLPSINLILPYGSPAFIRGTSNESIYNLSQTSIENAIDILTTLEKEYQSFHERSLTLKQLGEVFISPRCPDHGKNIDYDLNLKASQYLKNDLEHLKRIENSIKRYK